MEIVAKVKFNDRIALILNERPKLVYHRIGSYIIYGTDGVFYNCYRKESYGDNWKAFGGRKFQLEIEEDGEIVNCYGQWWDAGYSEVSKHLNINLHDTTAQSLDELKKCYVFTGYHSDKIKLQELVDNCPDKNVYDYRDYEKIIRYDDMLKRWISKRTELERDKKNLIKSIKEKHQQLLLLTDESKQKDCKCQPTKLKQ